MPYLNVEEVESALELAAATPNDAFTERLALPHLTWEGRRCHLIRIGAGSGDRAGVYFVGGVHAREWGSADILVNFVELVTEAYRSGSGITLPGKSFTAPEVKRIVETLDVFVFPQVNPDGRAFSMSFDGDEMWRKNRRPAPSEAPGCMGVDINRNYDWLWDFEAHFADDAPVSASKSPCHAQVYIGPSAASEPETRNVVSVLDDAPAIQFFIDVHSYSQLVLHAWGDDDNQSNSPAMNFMNPAHASTRGHLDARGHPLADRYREFIDPQDERTMVELGSRLRDAIKDVHGSTYKVQQAADLYPTSGASDDYVYSRHIVDPSKSKVYAFVIEWGKYKPDDIAGSFHPAYPEMVGIIEEITAGLIEFCLAAVDALRPPPIDTDRWASVLHILFGITEGGGGLALTPGGKPVPVGPDGPLRLLDAHKRDVLVGLAITELGGLVADPASRAEIESQGLQVIERAVTTLRTGRRR